MPREVGDLRARIGDRLDEHEARRRRERALDVRRVRRIDERHRRAVRRRASRAGCSCCRRGTSSRRRGRRRAAAPAAIAPIAAMPVAKQTVATPLFHRVDLRLERGRRRIALAAVRVARLPALEHGDEVGARRGSRRRPTRAAACAARRARSPASRSEWRIAVVKPRCVLVVMTQSSAASCHANKKPVERPPNGFRVPRPISPGWSEPRFSGIC